MFIETVLIARGGVLTEADMANELYFHLVIFMLLIMTLKLIEFLQEQEEADEQ